MLFIQPAGTLQDAAQSQTERNVTPVSSLCTYKSAQSRKRIRIGAEPSHRLASVQTWRETLNDHGGVVWRGQVRGHMPCLASIPCRVNWDRGRSGQRRGVKPPFNCRFCSVSEQMGREKRRGEARRWLKLRFLYTVMMSTVAGCPDSTGVR